MSTHTQTAVKSIEKEDPNVREKITRWIETERESWRTCRNYILLAKIVSNQNPSSKKCERGERERENKNRGRRDHASIAHSRWDI
jgi:hypothetical protein